jgi:hypothetical protein
MLSLHESCPQDPGSFLVVRDDTGAWSAVCKTCGTCWVGGQDDVPDHVKVAAGVAAGMTAKPESEAEANGGHILRVGDRVYETPKPETVEWVLTPDLIQCTFLVDKPSKTEEAAFHKERAEFALTSGDHALVLGVRFGRDIDWADGTWQAVRQREFYEPGVTDPGETGHLAVLLRLVDASTGILLAMRQVTWPPSFGRAVYKAIQSQLIHDSSDEAGAIEINTWMHRYPNPRDLALQRAEITCRGGAD